MMIEVLNTYVLVKVHSLKVEKTDFAYLNAKGNSLEGFWNLLGNQKGNKRDK